ncbi:MAG: cupin domain-containing protein [Burkholderiaceae bacterium]
MKEPKHDTVLEQELLDRLLEAGEPIDPPDETKARIRADLLRRARRHEPVKSSSSENRRSDLPDALITVRPEDAQPWRDFVPGVKKRVLFELGSCKSFLLQMAPGAVVPAHDHPHDEECVVLEGEIMVDGISMPQGTFHVAPAGVRHSDLYSPEGALLFIKTGHLRPTVPA